MAPKTRRAGFLDSISQSLYMVKCTRGRRFLSADAQLLVLHCFSAWSRRIEKELMNAKKETASLLGVSTGIVSGIVKRFTDTVLTIEKPTVSTISYVNDKRGGYHSRQRRIDETRLKYTRTRDFVREQRNRRFSVIAQVL